MQNQNNKFEILIKEACSALDLSYLALKDKYKNRSICLMQYFEKEIDEQVIEARFDNHLATLSFSFNKENNCNGSFLFFDDLKEEDSFIAYLSGSKEYDYKCSRWIMTDCFLKIKSSKYETAFYFYR